MSVSFGVARKVQATFMLGLLACASAPTPPLTPSATLAAPAAPLAATTPAAAPALPTGTRPSTAHEARAIARLMRTAEQVRHLRFVRPVPVLVQNRTGIMEYARSRLVPEELDRARTIYTALGLLPDKIDLADLLLRLLGEQVVGYYDEQSAQLIVRDEVMRAFDEKAALPAAKLAEATMTLVHELVHALQDQHLRLGERLQQHRDTDASNAFKALYEGDAMLAMSAAARPNAPPDVLARDAIHASATLRGSELESAPAIVRTPLLFAYLDGQAYVAQLLTSGGWARVDEAYTSPPESTEEVLHPERPVDPRRERPRLVDPERAIGPGWSLLYEDTLGELELSVYFARALAPSASQRAAEGWRGDRLYIFQNRDDARVLAVWLTAWDTLPDALEARDAALRVRAVDASRVPTTVLQDGRDVLVVRGGSEPPAALAEALLRLRAQH